MISGNNKEIDTNVPPGKTVIVAAESRTGSNYLCALMAKTGKLGNPQEYFSPHIVIGDAVTIAEQYKIALDQGVTANGILSIKLFAHHLDRIYKKNHRFSELFPNRFWIWLQRRDLLAQAISRVIALQTRSWHDNVESESTSFYNRNEITRSLRYITIANARWNMFFTRNNIQPLILWYENLVADPINTIMQISSFTGAEIKPFEINTSVHTSMQRTHINEDWKNKFISEATSEDYLDVLWNEYYHARNLSNFFKFISGKLPCP